MKTKMSNMTEEVSRQVQSAIAPLAKKIQENTDLTVEVRENTRKFMELSEERDARVESLKTSLDRHIDIYKKNGIESKRLADLVEKHIEDDKKWKEEMIVTATPVISVYKATTSWFSGSKTIITFLAYIAGSILTIVGAYQLISRI